MFGYKKLLKRVEELERKSNIIGEAYLGYVNPWSLVVDGVQLWKKFTSNDIIENRDTEIKLKIGASGGVRVPKNRVLFYDDIYKSAKTKIVKLAKPEKENK